jgi:hypothetical protein
MSLALGLKQNPQCLGRHWRNANLLIRTCRIARLELPCRPLFVFFLLAPMILGQPTTRFASQGDQALPTRPESDSRNQLDDPSCDARSTRTRQ